MAIVKMDPLHSNLTVPIIIAVIIGTIHLLVAFSEKKNIKQTFHLLIKTEILVLPFLLRNFYQHC